MYNMVHGATLATFFILPMLGKHADDYPRFRDCFTNDDEHPEYKDHIHVYTRVGGGNRGQDYGEEELYKHPNFVTSFDDNFDCTYATYVFSVPDEWKEDFNKVCAGNVATVSEDYQKLVRKIYPKLKDKFDEIWSAKGVI